MNLDNKIKSIEFLRDDVNKDNQRYMLCSKAEEKKDGGDIDGAIDLYEQIKRSTNEEENEIYAHAQIALSTLYGLKQNFEKVELVYINIKEIDSKELYGIAQYELGLIYLGQGKIKKAIQNFSSITQSNGGDYLYVMAQYLLGDLSISCAEKAKYWENISKDSFVYRKFAYEIELIKKINYSISDSKKHDGYFLIFENIDQLLGTLFIDSKYERLLAHYTNVPIAKLLLSKNKADLNAESLLRLNTINFMNDPEEGLLLNKLLCINSKINTGDSAFISCFTLHHDSLNQFRLYGKRNQQEATGVSLVFSKDFFSVKHNTLSMFEKNEKKNNLYKLIYGAEKILKKMQLYRCIYLDPTSGLIKVAQREEWSFHREYKKEKKETIIESNPEAEQNWKEYQTEILQIESEVKTHLKELAEQVKRLNPENLNDEEKELLAEILLPLRYLIKHMAFKEEQECRMIYVTQMDNPLIKYDEKINRIYIDYEASVMEHLEKIYLAPKAKDEQMVFEHLCIKGREVRKGKPDVNVRISKNPFR